MTIEHKTIESRIDLLEKNAKYCFGSDAVQNVEKCILEGEEKCIRRMRENKEISNESICYGCKFGRPLGHLKECGCPNLREGALVRKTKKTIDAMNNARIIAEGKGIRNYDPLPYIAVVRATIEKHCRYYQDRIK